MELEGVATSSIGLLPAYASPPPPLPLTPSADTNRLRVLPDLKRSISTLSHHRKRRIPHPLPTMSSIFKIRSATEEDFEAMWELDYAANTTHPVYNVPFKKTGIEGVKAFVFDRYNHLYHCRKPECVFLVATAGDEDKVVGYLFYMKPLGEGEREKWNHTYLEGTDLEFFDYLWRRFGEEAAPFEEHLKECWGTYRDTPFTSRS